MRRKKDVSKNKRNHSESQSDHGQQKRERGSVPGKTEELERETIEGAGVQAEKLRGEEEVHQQ